MRRSFLYIILFALSLPPPLAHSDGITAGPSKAWESTVAAQDGRVFYLDATYDALCYKEFTSFDDSDDGLLRLRKFNKSTKTWGTDVIEVYSNSSANPNEAVCWASGDHVHVMMTRRNAGGSFKDVVHFYSNTIAMESWTTPTVLYTYGSRRGNVHGQAVYVEAENKWLIPHYSHNGSQTAGSWRNGYFESTDGGFTWTLDETAIYGEGTGNIKWGENAIASAGGCKLVTLLRNQSGNTNVGQSISNDCGANWSNPDTDFTSIATGSGGVAIPAIYYDEDIDRLVAPVHDRGTGANTTKLYVASPDAVFADPDNWGAAVIEIDEYFAAGYPTLSKIDADEFLIIYFREDITPNTSSNRNREDVDVKYIIYQIIGTPVDPVPDPGGEMNADYGGVTMRGLTFG